MRPAPLPSSLGEVFTVRDARAAGVTPDRLRASDLAIPHRGTRAPTAGAAPDVAARALAIRPLLTEGRRLSHLTAAQLLGMRVPASRGHEPLHVTYPGAARAMRRPGVIGHRTTLSTRPVAGPVRLPLTPPVETWIECASMLAVDDMVVMGDGLVRRRSPPANRAQLSEAVRRARGRRGTARLRTALELIRPGTDSAPETTLRLLVVRGGLPEPEVNGLVRDRRGRAFAHGDLLWPDLRLVLEYEGRQHAESTEQFSLDIRRLNDISDAGYRVIRIDRFSLRDVPAMVATIRRAYRECKESRRGLRWPA